MYSFVATILSFTATEKKAIEACLSAEEQQINSGAVMITNVVSSLESWFTSG